MRRMRHSYVGDGLVGQPATFAGDIAIADPREVGAVLEARGSCAVMRDAASRCTYLYYAAPNTQDEQSCAAVTIKYQMMTGAVKKQVIADIFTRSLISDELTPCNGVYPGRNANEVQRVSE
jgi:hypothetical protein